MSNSEPKRKLLVRKKSEIRKTENHWVADEEVHSFSLVSRQEHVLEQLQKSCCLVLIALLIKSPRSSHRIFNVKSWLLLLISQYGMKKAVSVKINTPAERKWSGNIALLGYQVTDAEKYRSLSPKLTSEQVLGELRLISFRS